MIGKAMMIVAVFSLVLSSGCIKEDSKDTVCIGEKCFSVELADTPDKRTSGLMGRDGLGDGAGMLFVFDKEGNHSFWMKDMRFEIDIVWINSDREIVYISSDAKPCEPIGPCLPITPPEKALYVLEVDAGKAYGLKAGDTATFSRDF